MKQKGTEKQKTWMFKPSGGLAGDGIFLFQSPRGMPDINTKAGVVQEYIANPMLIDGLKFDLRVYVLVTSVKPLRAFVHREAMARFATQAYVEPTETNMRKAFMHLTNYSLNKYSETFEVGLSVDLGSKRAASSLDSYFYDHGFDVEVLWNRIHDMITKTLVLLQPYLSVEYQATFPKDEWGNKSFHLFGFDVLLDDECNPYLLEINHSPSLSCDGPTDSYIKEWIVTETLMGASFEMLHDEEEEEIADMSWDEMDELRIDFEDEAMPGFVRLFPTGEGDDALERYGMFNDDALIVAFLRAAGVRGSGEMSSARFSQMIRRCKLYPQFTSVDGPAADLLYISIMRQSPNHNMKYSDFCEALQRLAFVPDAEQESKDRLDRIMDRIITTFVVGD